jgi:hypothetical protein
MVTIAINSENFREVVEAEIRGEVSQAQAKWLREPQNVERWYWDLIAVKKNIESQLGSRKAYLLASKGLSDEQLKEKKQDFYLWKAKILRFKSGTEERIIEARQLRRTSWLREDVILEERNAALETVSILRSAIYAHQQANRNMDPTSADQKLWNML